MVFDNTYAILEKPFDLSPRKIEARKATEQERAEMETTTNQSIQPIPVFDATRYIDATISELVSEFGTTRRNTLTEPESRAIDVLVERVVHDVRSASTAELAHSSVELDDLSRQLPESSEARIRIDTLASVTQSAAAQFTDSARPAVLRSFEGKAEKALVHLAVRAKPVSLIDLRSKLQVQESNGSYLVGELMRAGLVHREKRGRTVDVWLSDAGRTYVATHLGDELAQGNTQQNTQENAKEKDEEFALRVRRQTQSENGSLTLRPQTLQRLLRTTQVQADSPLELTRLWVVGPQLAS
jgi:predicted transcriptional regulator